MDPKLDPWGTLEESVETEFWVAYSNPDAAAEERELG